MMQTARMGSLASEIGQLPRRGAGEVELDNAADEAPAAALYEGEVDLVITLPTSDLGLSRLCRLLKADGWASIISTVGWSGCLKTTILMRKPGPLVGILREMPIVERALDADEPHKISGRLGSLLGKPQGKKRRTIVVTLKAPTSSEGVADPERGVKAEGIGRAERVEHPMAGQTRWCPLR